MKYSNLILPDNQYYQEAFKKDLIVLHHTVSSGKPEDVINYWKSTPETIGTCFVIGKNGDVFSCFRSEKHWAWHIGGEAQLGCSYSEALKLNQRSIGIELISMGALKLDASGNYLDANGRIFRGEIYKFPQKYRGFDASEAYTEAQLKALIELVNYLLKTHGIPKDIPEKPWERNKYWLQYTGVVSHTTLRSDKTDVHPGFPYDRLRKECDLQIDS